MLTVNGSSFVSGSTVRWNGANRTTTFVNSGQLTASILASDLASVGTVPVTVFTPTPGGGTSSAVNFTVTPVFVVPSSFSWVSGSVRVGTVAGLASSDNVYVEANGKELRLARNESSVAIEAVGTTSVASVSRIDITVESGSDVSGHFQRILAWNYTTSAWDVVDAVATTATDMTRTISITVNPNRYLSGGTMKIQADIRGPVVMHGRYDLVRWTLYP